MNKVRASATEAVADIPDGASLAVGGFGLSGVPTDFALVRAWRGDRHGNLVFRRAAANFNPPAAMAGRITIAEVEELAEPGELRPDEIHLPGVYVQRIVVLTAEEAADKKIEKRTVRS